MNAIEVRELRKTYRRYGRRRHFGTLKSALLSGRLFEDLRPDEVLQALDGVTFDVAAGRTFGIIGRNGSGKSTLLKLIAGIGKPTSGSVRVTGRVSALIELGAGFHPEISGRENVFINGMMLGLSKREIARRFDEIVAFAELEDFIDAPVKTYSSGMYMRLGFAVAINVDPDVLLVDEVLAVGDQAFTHRCLDKFAELRTRGRTVLIVTHTLDMITRFCDEALWIDAGQARLRGAPDQVVDAYLSDVARGEHEAQKGVSPAQHDAAILEVRLLGRDGLPATAIASGDGLIVEVHVRASRPLRDVVCEVGIFNADGVRCVALATGAVSPLEISADAVLRLDVDRLELVGGAYTLDCTLRSSGGAQYDREQRCTFTVTAPSVHPGIVRPPHRWSFSGAARPVPQATPETRGGSEK
jgi:lipopolysaccharide transport system ATP-binding protein